MLICLLYFKPSKALTSHYKDSRLGKALRPYVIGPLVPLLCYNSILLILLQPLRHVNLPPPQGLCIFSFSLSLEVFRPHILTWLIFLVPAGLCSNVFFFSLKILIREIVCLHVPEWDRGRGRCRLLTGSPALLLYFPLALII